MKLWRERLNQETFPAVENLGPCNRHIQGGRCTGHSWPGSCTPPPPPPPPPPHTPLQSPPPHPPSAAEHQLHPLLPVLLPWGEGEARRQTTSSPSSLSLILQWFPEGNLYTPFWTLLPCLPFYIGWSHNLLFHHSLLKGQRNFFHPSSSVVHELDCHCPPSLHSCPSQSHSKSCAGMSNKLIHIWVIRRVLHMRKRCAKTKSAARWVADAERAESFLQGGGDDLVWSETNWDSLGKCKSLYIKHYRVIPYMYIRSLCYPRASVSTLLQITLRAPHP